MAELVLRPPDGSETVLPASLVKVLAATASELSAGMRSPYWLPMLG